MALTQKFGPQVGYTRLHISKNNVDLVRTHLCLPYECFTSGARVGRSTSQKNSGRCFENSSHLARVLQGWWWWWWLERKIMIQFWGFTMGWPEKNPVLDLKYYHSNIAICFDVHSLSIEFWIFPTLRFFLFFFQIWNRHSGRSMAWQHDITSSYLSEMYHTHIASYSYILLYTTT